MRWIPPFEDIKWQETRNGVTGLTKACIGYENGVLGGVVSALNVLCSKGDSVLLHSPTYIGFTGALTNNGYHIVHSQLKKDGGKSGAWILRIWKRKSWRIISMPALCALHITLQDASGRSGSWKKHDVYVISDEIWSDLILDGYKHIPTQMISEVARNRTIAMYAPSKTFNLAGRKTVPWGVWDPHESGVTAVTGEGSF